jgi:Zc3h12a-like Ribonuclease NYN domain
MKREKAIVDGSNAAYLQAPRERRPRLENISAIAVAVELSGRDPVIIMDPGIRSLVAETDELDSLLSDARTTILPDGKDIGRFVLETAERLNGVIVSNNTYAEFFEEYPWVEQRRIPVAVVNGAIMLLDTKMKRAS